MRTFTSYDVCRIARISFRQLDYWTRAGRVTPSFVVQSGTPYRGAGSGFWRRFTLDEVFFVSFIARLREAGVSFEIIDDALVTLRDSPHLKRLELATHDSAVRITVDLVLIRRELEAACSAA